MIRLWWYALQRRIDIQMLWPSCRELALEEGYDVDFARGMFTIHARMDPAWFLLGESEMVRRIGELT